MMLYFKRFWDETTGDQRTDNWGTSTYYFETNESGEVFRQLEVFANGKRLKYSQDSLDDEYGGLSDIALDLEEFGEYKISEKEFESAWRQECS